MPAILRKFGNDIWLCDGEVVTAAAGFHFPTRMAIIRLSGKRLFVWSPVELTDAIRYDVAELGTVAYIVAPNSLHDSFLGQWAAEYPEVPVFSAPGLAENRPDVTFSGVLGETAPDDWKDEIDQVVVGGNAITTEVVFFHRASGTVLFTDLLQQFPKGWFAGWRALVARLDLMTLPEPNVPRKFRIAFRDKTKARAAVGKILGWEAEKVVMAHGQPVEQNGAAFLRQAFRWLKASKC